MPDSATAFDPTELQRALLGAPANVQRVVASALQAEWGQDPEAENTRFRIYTAADALQPQPPIDWIVKLLAAPGATHLWAGEGGSKKTYSLLDMGVCIALGKPWLEMETRQCSVLVIDEESGPRRMARRLGEVLRGHYADESTPIFYISLALFNLREKPDLSALHSKINETGAKLVIIDALVDVMPGADENAAGEVHPIFQGLRSIADATESCIIVIHHHNKAGAYRGSTAIKGAVDCVVNLSSKPSDAKVEFVVEKSRDAEEFKWAAECRWVEDTFDMVRTESEDGRPAMGKAERYVLRLLGKNGESSIADIQAGADSCTPSGARQAVYSLADKGIVERTNSGGRDTPAIYGLTEKGKKWS